MKSKPQQSKQQLYNECLLCPGIVLGTWDASVNKIELSTLGGLIVIIEDRQQMLDKINM